MKAELIRIANGAIDIKVVTDKTMHILQWRRHMFRDEVLLDGKRQQVSRGLMWGRETIYGLVFGRDEDGEGGSKLIFTIDSRHDWNSLDLDEYSRPRGVRLEDADNALLVFGTLDPKEMEKPSTFMEALKKNLGMQW